jgi:hypothetical protein
MAFTGRMVIAATLVAVSLTAFSGGARASPASWVKQALAIAHGGDGRASAAPLVARYSIDEGGAFIFDRSTRRPLLKFDNPEVWVLSPSHGPRGDIIYKNDLGEPMLRATRLGGMTVFTPRRPEGSAAALIGASSPLRLASIGPLALYQRLVQSSIRCSRAAQHLVGFDAPDTDAASDGLVADSALIITDALVGLSARAGGRAMLARLDRVAFARGTKPGAAYRGGVLTVTFVPTQGFAGRPSSLRVLDAVGAR